jgi:hypothetical protein
MGFAALLTGHHIDLHFVFSSDVSWGTKGDNKVSTDLGVVKVGKNTNEVEVAVPTAETDLNAAYEDAIHVLSTKPPKVESKPDAATEQEDYYRSFRTKCVTAISSFLLVQQKLTFSCQRAIGVDAVERMSLSVYDAYICIV